MINLRQTIELFGENEIEFVIVGGIAITLHGSSYLTADLDLCYKRSKDNLERIAAALSTQRPRLRGAPEGLPFVWDAETLRRGMNFTLTTDLGDIDLLGEVAGVGGYEEAFNSSVAFTLYGHEVRILSLGALIQSKRAAGRPKDLLVLPELEALREVLESKKD